MTGPGQPRHLYALLWVVTFATAVGNLGLVSVMPAIGRALAIPDALIACIFSGSALVWALMSPVWARRSDRQGRKPMLLVGIAGFAGSMAGCALVVFAGLSGLFPALAIFAIFAIVRASYGLFGPAAVTAAQALIADTTAGVARVRALSGLAGALSLGTIMGPAIAPFFLGGRPGLAGPPLAFALMGSVVLVAILVSLPRDAPVGQQQAYETTSLWRDQALRPLLIHGLVIASAQAINIYTLGFALLDSAAAPAGQVQWLIGLAMALGAASSAAAQFWAVRPFGSRSRAMLHVGAGLAMVGNLVAILPLGIWAVVAGFVLASFGYGLARPGFAATASLAVGPERQGEVAGAVSSIAGASIAIPPIIAVALYQVWWSAPFVICAASAAWVALRDWRMFPWSD